MGISVAPIDPSGSVGGPPVVKYKAVAETVTSSATLQNDDDLLFAVGANEVWVVEFVLYASGEDAGDILVDVYAPTGASGTWGAVGPAAANTTDSSNTRHRGNVGLTTAGINLGLIDAIVTIERVYATVINGSTAGDAGLRWCQATSNVTGTKLEIGSSMIAHRIA